ncbi:MAG: hypothetical protein F6J95_005630 [Leptolyngbya sp. SIO1E4]|nr:hypothetical protein [Leptolyngbya sp. SIO1E4]
MDGYKDMQNKIIFLSAVTLLLVGCNALAPSEEPAETQAPDLETQAPSEVSLVFRAGMLSGCLDSSGYDAQGGDPNQNQTVMAFCLCYVDEAVTVAEVEDDQVSLPSDLSPVFDTCEAKVSEEISGSN